MAKIRAKNLKPKATKDFKKKTAKVGRKVQPSNVTKIDVRSKQINIPLQSQFWKADGLSESEIVENTMRQLSHHSSSHREAALGHLKQFMVEAPNSHLYVSRVIPRVLELLFDEDRDIRSSLVTLMNAVLAKYSLVHFQPISSVMSTYVCCGLSNVSKGIRKDSLIVLRAILDSHRTVFDGFVDKIAEHLLAIFSDTSLNHSQDSVASNKTAHKDKEGSKRSNMLALGLAALAALLRQTTVPDDTKACSTNSMVDCRHRRCHSLWGMQSRLGLSFSNEALSRSIGCLLMNKLTEIWQGFVLGSDSLSAPVVAALLEIADVVAGLSQIECLRSTSELRVLLHALFRHFPYSSSEAAVAVPGSKLERETSSNVELLNLTLCGFSLVVSADLINPDDKQSKKKPAEISSTVKMLSKKYLINRLECVIRSANRSIPVEEGDSQILTRSDSASSGTCSHPRNTAMSTEPERMKRLFSFAAKLCCQEDSLLLKAAALDSKQTIDSIAHLFYDILIYLQNSHQRDRETLLKPTVLGTSKLILGIELAWLDPKCRSILLKCAARSLQLVQQHRCFEVAQIVLDGFAKSLRYIDSTSIITDANDKSITQLFGEVTLDLFSPETAMFSQLDSEIRMEILNTFAFSPFADVGQAARVVSNSLVACEASLTEYRAFFRLLYYRRQEMAVEDFLESLFGIMEKLTNENQKDPLRDDVVLQKIRELSDIFAEIGSTLGWCASNETPSKLLSVILPYLQPSTAFSESIKDNSSTDDRWESSEFQILSKSVAVFQIVGTLLRPTISTDDTESVITDAERLLIFYFVHCVNLVPSFRRLLMSSVSPIRSKVSNLIQPIAKWFRHNSILLDALIDAHLLSIRSGVSLQELVPHLSALSSLLSHQTDYSAGDLARKNIEKLLVAILGRKEMVENDELDFWIGVIRDRMDLHM